MDQRCHDWKPAVSSETFKKNDVQPKFYAHLQCNISTAGNNVCTIYFPKKLCQFYSSYFTNLSKLICFYSPSIKCLRFYILSEDELSVFKNKSIDNLLFIDSQGSYDNTGPKRFSLTPTLVSFGINDPSLEGRYPVYFEKRLVRYGDSNYEAITRMCFIKLSEKIPLERIKRKRGA